MALRSSVEKHDVESIEHKSAQFDTNNGQAIDIGGFRVFGLDPADAEFYENYPEEKRKRVFRKVDFRLVPMLALLYLICHIDRANIGNAKIEGMVEDLGMTGLQYNIVLSICEYHALLSASLMTRPADLPSQSSSPTSFSRSPATSSSRCSSAPPCTSAS